MTNTDKKTAVLVALVQAGVVDLESLANKIAKKLPAGALDPDLGASFGGLVGRWYVFVGEEHLTEQ